MLAALSADDVLRIHYVLCADFAEDDDPIGYGGLRSQALLDSAVGRQHAGFGPFKKYPDAIPNAATLTYGICNDHPLALRLACCWARWIARRNLAKGVDDIDLGRIAGLLETARQGLATSSKIRTALNGSKTQIDRALGHVEALVVEVEAALQGIEDEVAA